MLGKILTKVAKMIYPKRDISVERIGWRFFPTGHDTAGCNSYLLDGTYSYSEVVRLNALTTYSAGFGFCSELGPIAFIGIPNAVLAQRSGYFEYKVHEYGSIWDSSKCYFRAYTGEEAKNIQNYTVYGLEGLRKVATRATISQMKYVYDSRFKAKESDNPRVFDMDYKLKGVYSYNEAKLLATGTLKEKQYFSGEEHPIVFATVGVGHHVGIINMWPEERELVLGFREVWEYGAEEPETQTINFLTKAEASKIEDFTLYVYTTGSGNGMEKYQIEIYDRTFDKRFKFQLSDGSDYRLI